MSHLLLLSIGPVQEFIASARRFRDLWFGSFMLSNVAEAAARALEGPQNTLIFPTSASLAAKGGREEAAKVANKLLAIVDGDPAQWADRASVAAREALAKLAEKPFAALNASQREMAEAQVRDLLEIQWVAVPQSGAYADDRRKAERLLAARKNTRDFVQPAWARAGRPKSSLDGLREAVVDPKALDARARRDLGLREAENLCGVGILKRLGGGKMRVPSTSHMAAVGCLLDVTTPEARDAVHAAAEQLLRALRETDLKGEEIERRDEHPVLGRLNGQVLYENRLKELCGDDEPGLEKASRAVRYFLQTVSDTGFRLHSYYALLKADGDHMGAAIARMASPQEHQRFSDDLEGFAHAAGEIVERHEGFLVFSGGDDVEALLPLHTVLACARSLADEFAKRMGAHAGDGVKPTLSVGVAVGHQLEPVGDARRRLDEAEKLAKEDRNALGLIIKKRGGTEQRLKGSWTTLDARLVSWTALHKDNRLPDGAAYELRRLASELGKDAPAGAYKAETARILKRKRVDDQVEVDQVVQDAILAHATKAEHLEHLAEELIAARLFAYPGDR